MRRSTPSNSAIVYKKYINVGVAVDTEFGLLVPVIRNADQKNITQIAVELHQLSEKARAKKLTLDEMSGGGISISNLGGIGGTYFTPIVNWPEVAILGVSRGIIEPVWRERDKFEPRQLLPLSLSYDHRVIDGADAMRFLRWVVAGDRTALPPFTPRLTWRANPLNLSSSARGRAATRRRSMPPTSACRSRSSTRRRIPAASACIAAAFRRRRCCTSPR